MRIAPPLHPDEFCITYDLVKHLLTTQVPLICRQSLRPVLPGGTDHVMVRVGENLVARFPRHPGACHATEIERDWLPRLTKVLSTEVPNVYYSGEKDYLYSASWSIISWLHGKVATPFAIEDSSESASVFARDLGNLVKELQGIPIPQHISISDLPKSYRTGSLAQRDVYLKEALNQCAEVFDREVVLAAWEADKLAGGHWGGPPVAAHGDLQPSNLVIDSQTSRLVGAIDWGGLSFGDPAVDLLPAWMLLNQYSRPIFREVCGVDERTWRRGRAWALSIGIIAYPYYRISRPEHAEVSKRQVEQALGSFQTD